MNRTKKKHEHGCGCLRCIKKDFNRLATSKPLSEVSPLPDEHLLVNIDSRDQAIEILVIRYDKRNGKLELLQDNYICKELLGVRNLIQDYLKKLEQLKSVSIDSDHFSRDYLTRSLK